MTRTTKTEIRQITRSDIEANYTALRRIEKREHRRAEAECNGVQYWTHHGETIDLWTDEGSERLDAMVEQDVCRVLGFRPLGLFINGDPRGYALKVEPEHAGDLHKDWGGYGIIAPDKSA